MTDPSIAHYKAARAEILARMGKRKKVLTVYLGFAGAVLGVAVAESPLAGAVFVMPVIAYGVAWLFRDHELALAYLGRWLRATYTDHLRHTLEDASPPHWDTSPARDRYGEQVLRSRYVTFALVLVGSSVAAVVVAWTPYANQPSLFDAFGFGSVAQVLWTTAGVVFTGLTAAMLRATWRTRAEIGTVEPNAPES